MIDKEKKFLIVGLGLIGGSYAMGLKEAGYTVYAIDVDPDSIAFAKEQGYIDAGKSEVDPALLGRADVVILGLYPKTMIQWLKDYQQHLKPGAFLTDVSGVKCGVIDQIQGLLRKDVRFIGSHPMAGREVSGVFHSDNRIFQDANFIITPTQKNTQQDIDFVWDIAEVLGFLHISILSPREHDEMIGFVSQLTHAIAVSLMNCNDNTHLKEYTGDSFRDLTRIAKINENLWSELFLLNRETLIQEIDGFAAELQNLREKLVQGDEKGLKKLFIQSTQRRKQFDRTY